jgi:hypothetical protein
MEQKTNGELLEIISNPSHQDWQAAINELDERMTTAGVKNNGGFDTPQNPPPIP